MRVRDADIRPSLSTRAATGIARSVRLTRATAGSKRGEKNCCPHATSTWSLRLPRQLSPLALQNKREIYALLFRASAETLHRGRPRSRSASARRSDSSASCTPGTRNSSIIRTFTVSFPPAVWLRTTRGGSTRSRSFFLPVGVLREVFRGKFVEGLRTTACGAQTRFPRNTCRTAESEDVRSVASSAVPLPMGGLLETSFRRCATCASLSRPVHPSRGDLQPSTRRTRRWHGHVPLARFRSQKQEASDDAAGRRVPAPIPAARAAAWIRPHPPLRVSGSSPPRRHAPALLSPAGRIQAGFRPKPGLQEKADSSPRPLWTCPQCGGPNGPHRTAQPHRASIAISASSRRHNHDTIFLITTPAPTRAPSPHVRPPLARRKALRLRKHSVPTTGRDAREQSILSDPQPSPASPPFKTHSVERSKTASFKSLYRKRSGAHAPASPKLSSPERSRYSTKTSRE